MLSRRDLGLGTDCRDRRAKLVRRMRGEAPLGLHGRRNACEQRVQPVHQRVHLHRYPAIGQRSQVAWTAPAHFVAEVGERSNGRADDQPHQHAEQRDAEQQGGQPAQGVVGEQPLAQRVVLATCTRTWRSTSQPLNTRQ